MTIVVDSNIIFAALIKDSTVRKIIYQINNSFVIPEIVLEEIRNYKKEILEKSGLSEKYFEEALGLILKCIRIIPNEQIHNYKTEAWNLIKDHSPEDVMFIACALAFEDSILWSDDKKLKRQNKIKVLNTSELIKTFQ
ncbi:MAG TPA: PIN domain-containing protein [Candidatus Nanoarchaeia archaeon]|nr:PIN domain-containing protein [Candidatus Nanoarchaeia archaeon]